MIEKYKLARRKYIIGGFISLLVLIYIVKLFNLQVSDSSYKLNADSNAYLRRTIYPSRGLIYDRNGELIVYNQPTYDIMVVPREIEDFDSTAFCEIMRIQMEDLRQLFEDMRNTRKNPGYSTYTAQRLMAHLNSEDYGRLEEKLYLFPGMFIQKRTERQYNHLAGANILGNIREVSASDLERDEYYHSGDYTGDLGVEKSYENQLRGEKGEEILMKDALGKIQGKYKGGEYDTAPIAGKDLTLSIDIELQKYGEKLMRNKKGAIVAIEPSTGEILCLVTSPSYDPSLLTGKERGKNYANLSKDPNQPLFDRAMQGMYPPGSTFKPTQGLIFLQEGVVTEGTPFPCAHGYVNKGMKVGCHAHESPIALVPALGTSCNSYFCWGFKNMVDRNNSDSRTQLTKWKDYLVEMGYGYPLGVDLPSERRGFIPNAEYYDKNYKDNWSANTIISVSIGQGEVLATPVQIANLCAQIANRGWYYTPHIVKKVEDGAIAKELRTVRKPHIDSRYYEPIIRGMRAAVTGGTCKGANLPDFEVCGKTGTAQNPHGRDHSAFIGFAPMNNPKIAVAVYVENAGFGAAFGVPIGSLIIEKYMKGEISPDRKGLESRMITSNTIKPESGDNKH